MKPISDDVRKEVERLWSSDDFHGSYTGATRFQRALKSEGINLTYEQVASVLHSIPTYIDRVRKIRIKKTRPYRVIGVNQTWEADIAIMTRRQGAQYIGFLLCVDIFSRRVFTYLLSDRTGETLKSGFSKIFQENNGQKPNNLQTDKEFKKMKKWFNDQGIFTRFLIRRHKAALAELYVYKLKRRLFQFDAHNDTELWHTKLEAFTKNENNTEEPVLGGLKPSSIKSPADDERVWQSNPERPTLIHWQDAIKSQKKYEADSSKLQVGDLVLYDHPVVISKGKNRKRVHNFPKSYHPKVRKSQESHMILVRFLEQ